MLCLDDALAVALLLAAALLVLPARAQNQTDSLASDPDLEILFEETAHETGGPVLLLESLADLSTTPLDVNTASAAALSELPPIGADGARSVVRFRQRHGPFTRLDDLLAVDGWTEELLDAVRSFLTVQAPDEGLRFDPTPSLGVLLRGLRFDLVQRVERRLDVGRGYKATDGTGYVGSPERLSMRLRLTSGRQLSLSLTMEKDPGEAFRWNPATRAFGFDHVSAHAALRAYGRLRSLIVGDYVAAFGQGLIFWPAGALGKGREPVRPLVRAGRGLQPYRSMEENRFLRGFAATVRVTPTIDVSLFTSWRRLDGRLLEPDTSLSTSASETEALGFDVAGLHRTSAELAKRDVLRETLIGGHAGLVAGPIEGGLVGYSSRFARPFSAGEAPHARYAFSGDRVSMGGAYLNLLLGAFHLFGEAAWSSTRSVGGLGGISWLPAKQAELLVLLRAYPREFVSLHGFPFGERNGSARNEEGAYVGVMLRPAQRWRAAFFIDQYRFPWLRAGVPRPSSGREVFVLLEHRPRRWLTIDLQGRSERKEEGVVISDPSGRLLEGLQTETRESLRIDGSYAFSDRLRFRSRIEAARHLAPASRPQHGVMVYQDVRWHPGSGLRIHARWTLFDTDGFAARVYAYENDLRYGFKVPAFSGRGQRAYVLIRWQLRTGLTLELKAATTRYEDGRTVGSGLDVVQGRRIRSVGAQVLWRL